MADLEFTGERVVPGKVDEELLLEHVSRYRFASRLVAGRDVIDIGCGAGYGAEILRRAGARRVVATDLAPAAVSYASARYGERAVRFAVTDCEASCFAPSRFDAAVAFELIEHLHQPRSFLAEVRRVLRPGGVFVVSTPNPATYRTAPGSEPNPFHVHEFTLDELFAALREFFPAILTVGQSRTEGVWFGHCGKPAQGIERRAVLAADGNGSGDLASSAAYLLALCSDDAGALKCIDVDLFEIAETNAVHNRDLRLLELQAELEERTAWALQLQAESQEHATRVRELEEALQSLQADAVDGDRDARTGGGNAGRRLRAIQRWQGDSLVQQQEELERQRATLVAAVDREEYHGRLIEEGRRQVDGLQATVAGLRWRLDQQRAEVDAGRALMLRVQASEAKVRELTDLLWGSRSWLWFTRARRWLYAATGWLPRRGSHDPPCAPVESDEGRRRRALIVDHRMPTPDRDAGSTRMVELILLLQSLGFEVAFLPANLYAMAPYDEPLRRLGVELVVTPETTSLRTFLQQRGKTFELVLVSRFHIAAACFDEVRQACSKARVVFDTVDLQYLRLERQARLEGNPTLAALAERTKAQELGIAARSDATLVVSAVERELLAGELPASRVRRLSLIERTRLEIPAFAERRGFFFVGGFEHPPNVDAVLWFVAEVLPELRQRLPAAPFHVVGSKMPTEIRALADDGVVIRGHVPDLEPLLRACRLSVAPLRYGAGIKGKVVQSLAWGLPCVMTSAAAEGMGLRHGEDALIADEPADFASCIAEGYSDRNLWERLSLAGRRRIDDAFSPAVARATLVELVDELGLASPAQVDG